MLCPLGNGSEKTHLQSRLMLRRLLLPWVAPEESVLMMHVIVERVRALPDLQGLVNAAARCWRLARDTGRPAQQRLHAMLSRHECGILAPAFDSLMTLYEVLLGRPLVVGRTSPSDDEHLLADLLAGSRARSACLEYSKGIALAFDCAISSMRILIVQAVGLSPALPAVGDPGGSIQLRG